jgi:hypothetical protein
VVLACRHTPRQETGRVRLPWPTPLHRPSSGQNLHTSRFLPLARNLHATYSKVGVLLVHFLEYAKGPEVSVCRRTYDLAVGRVATAMEGEAGAQGTHEACAHMEEVVPGGVRSDEFRTCGRAADARGVLEGLVPELALSTHPISSCSAGARPGATEQQKDVEGASPRPKCKCVSFLGPRQGLTYCAPKRVTGSAKTSICLVWATMRLPKTSSS